MSWLSDAAQDARLAVRLLRKDLGFTIATVLVLGAGIAVSNTQFTLLNAICLRGLPITRVDRVLSIGARDARSRRLGLSYRELEELRTATPSFTGLAASTGGSLSVGDDDRAPDRAIGTYLSADGFALLGERLHLGRDFTPADDRPGAPPVAILADGFWKARYGGDPSLVGRRVRIDGRPTTVIGIAPEPFAFPVNTDVWLPLALAPGVATTRRTARTLAVFGRLRDRAPMAAVRAQLATASARLSHDFPDTNASVALTAVPINDAYNSDITNPAWLAFITVAVIVLLIACANAANLLLMRAVHRSHEVAVRASLGASRSRLVRQLLMESIVLATIGGLVGGACSVAGARFLWTIVPPKTLPYWMTFTLDGRALAVLIAVTLSTVFVFGLAPALHVSRADVQQLMKDGGRTSTSGVAARRWTTIFLTVEFGLTMILSAALVLGIRQTRAAVAADTVIDSTRVLTTSVTLPADRYGTPEDRAGFYSRVVERLTVAPDVLSVAVTSHLPLGGATARVLSIEGEAAETGGAAPTVWTVSVSPSYFRVLSLPLLSGRAFDVHDGSAGRDVAIVNQRFAQMFFNGADALGRRVRLASPNAAAAPTGWLTIVAVSASVRQRPSPDPDPIVYLPVRASPPATANIIVGAARDAAAIAPALRDVARGIDVDLPLYNVMTLDEAMSRSQWNSRLSTLLLNTIAVVSLLLAAVGLYAVVAHAVGQRTAEIGLRMALGARTSQVVWMVVRQSMTQLGVGLLAGGAGLALWNRAFGSAGGSATTHVFGDPLTLVGAASPLILVAAIATAWPAYCASRIDPAIVLRSE